MSEKNPEELPEADPPREFDEFTMVLLRWPDKLPDLSEPALEKLQRQHLGYLESLKRQGALLLSGPFRDQPDESWRGFGLYRTGLEETRRLAEQDPSVRAGRLRIDVFRWVTAKGALKLGNDPNR